MLFYDFSKLLAAKSPITRNVCFSAYLVTGGSPSFILFFIVLPPSLVHGINQEQSHLHSNLLLHGRQVRDNWT